jgi:hypothetical protein
MVYTIKIKDQSRKAKSIINMLKALQDDYDFIEIKEEQDEEVSMMKELESRYDSFLKSQTGKEWSVVMKDLQELK